LPAIQAYELKKDGFVRNNADLVVRGVALLHERMVDERLKNLRLKAFEKQEEEDNES